MSLKKSFILLFLTFSYVSAQSIFRFNEPRPLLRASDSGYAMQPRWSPDGKQIAFAGSNYQGIFIYTLANETVQKITDAPSAGFEFSWSPDSKSIAARVSKFEKGFRLNAIKVLDLKSGKAELINKFQPGAMSTPQWTSDNVHILYTFKKQFKLAVTKNEPIPSKNSSASFSKASEIIIKQTNAQDIILKTLPGLDIINLVASPDTKKYVFEALTGNMYVIDADGGNLINLGPGDSPAWSPDSRYIVYSITEDDGHVFTKSDLYIVSADGRFKQKITESDRLEMHPDWSPDGTSVIYDDYRDGTLYILMIKDKSTKKE